MSVRLLPSVVLLALLAPGPVLAKDRVADARARRLDEVKALVAQAGLRWPVGELYLRAFKHERVLEVWGADPGRPMVLLKSYPFCAASGELGPKRREGDLQVPEGFYVLQSFNPQSNFHLSLQVSYPNASDRVLSDRARPGGAIYIHGNCASIGCIAIEDAPIEEVYLLALDAKDRRIPIHIFPRRLDDAGLAALEGSAHLDFWRQLAPGFTRFEETRRPARVRVDPKTGRYAVSAGR